MLLCSQTFARRLASGAMTGALAGLAVFLALPAVGQTTLTLEQARATYEKSFRDLESAQLRQMASWPGDYRNALLSLRQGLQAKGNLEGYTEVDKELARFGKDPRIPGKASVNSPELAAVQQDHAARLSRVELKYARDVVTLTRKYLGLLDAQKKKLTIAGRIEEATKYSEETKRVQALPAVTAAEFKLEEYEASRTAASTAVAEVPENGAGGRGQPAGQTEEPVPSDPENGLEFKNMNLKPTSLARLLRTVNVTAGMATKENFTERSFGPRGRRRVRRGEIQHILRLSLRTASTSLVLTNLTVAVQFFEEADRKSTQTGASETAVRLRKLPRLTPEVARIVLEPVGLERRELDMRGRGGWEEGKELKGIVVNIFDTSGILVYQAASASVLDGSGLTRLPEERKPEPPRDSGKRPEARQTPGDEDI